MRVRRVVQYSGTERGGILKTGKPSRKPSDEKLGKASPPESKKRPKKGNQATKVEEFACPLCAVNLPEKQLVKHIGREHLPPVKSARP